uniref:Uncharacterized protein n=1 Tax=Rhizophora mucronata TaxID=61149 RepID=A0A2P2NTE3_RHIMU
MVMQMPNCYKMLLLMQIICCLWYEW